MNVLRNYLGKLQLFYNKLISFNKLNYERKKMKHIHACILYQLQQ